MRKTTLASGLAALLASTIPASVHPHVFAEARLDVMLNADNTVRSLRHLWRFDDLFSSTVLVEFDADGDLELNETELQDVAQTVYDSLADYNYFQMVTVDGKDVAMNPPPQLMVNFENEQLIIMFETEPKERFTLKGKVDFGVYDPTFYTALDYVDDANMAVSNLPDSCTRAVIRPDPDEALAQNQATLTEEFFSDPTGTDLSKIFATRLELTCTS